MDVKITLSFEETIALKAKEFAASKGMSLSRMVEHIFEQLTANPRLYNNLNEIPFAPFIDMVAEEEATYTLSSAKKRKQEYYSSRK